MRTAFRIVCFLFALVPLYFGALQLIYGTGSDSTALDSQFRYLSGLYVAVGIGLLVVAWQAERAFSLFAILALAAFLGGVGRYVSYADVGMPNPKQFYGMFVELLTPLLLFWLWVIRKRSAR